MKDVINPKRRYAEEDLIMCSAEIRSLRVRLHNANEIKISIIKRGEVPSGGLENQIALLKIRLNDNEDRLVIIRNNLKRRRTVNVESNNGR